MDLANISVAAIASAPIKVSIIVPVYNVEPYIEDCLRSLINQRLRDIEIILINDASTDSSGAICEAYAAKDPRITVLHNETNIRQGLSRNKGIEIARGEYLGFVDADDLIDTDFFEKLYLAAKKHNADIAKTERAFLEENGETTPQPLLNRRIKKAKKNGALLFNFFTYEHMTAIYRRELITTHNIGYADIRNAEDNVFLLQICLRLPSITLVSGTYYYYRQHPASAVSIRQEAYYRSLLQSLRIQKDLLESHSVSSRDYNLWFNEITQLLHQKYIELSQNQNLNTYKVEFVNEAAHILSSHHSNPGYLLEMLKLGTTWKSWQKGLPYRFAAAIFLLAKKFRDLIFR